GRASPSTGDGSISRGARLPPWPRALEQSDRHGHAAPLEQLREAPEGSDAKPSVRREGVIDDELELLKPRTHLRPAALLGAASQCVRAFPVPTTSSRITCETWPIAHRRITRPADVRFAGAVIAHGAGVAVVACLDRWLETVRRAIVRQPIARFGYVARTGNRAA